MKLLKVKIIGLFFIIVTMLSACEDIPPSIIAVMNNTNPPSFTFNGEGYFEDFSIFEVPPENLDHDSSPHAWSNDVVIWRIKKIGKRIRAYECPQITYAVVPSGFVQEIPDKGSPPKFEEGKIYAAFPTGAVPIKFVTFTIRNGKVVELPNDGSSIVTTNK